MSTQVYFEYIILLLLPAKNSIKRKKKTNPKAPHESLQSTVLAYSDFDWIIKQLTSKSFSSLEGASEQGYWVQECLLVCLSASSQEQSLAWDR